MNSLSGALPVGRELLLQLPESQSAVLGGTTAWLAVGVCPLVTLPTMPGGSSRETSSIFFHTWKPNVDETSL